MDRGRHHHRATVAEAEFSNCINGEAMRELELQRLRLNGFRLDALGRKRIETEWDWLDQKWHYWQTMR